MDRTHHGDSEAEFYQLSQVLSSSSGNSSDEDFYDLSNNENTADKSVSCEDDSDLESVPTVSHFKQLNWRNSQSLAGKNMHESLNQSKQGARKIFNRNKEEYIKKKSGGGLGCSGKLSRGGLVIKIHSSGSLLTSSKDNCVMRITIQNQNSLDFNESFENIKRTLFDQLVITEVLKDELLYKRNEIYHDFKNVLLDRIKKTANNLECAEDLLQFSFILGKYERVSGLDTAILTELADNNYISTELKAVTESLLEIEKSLCARNKNFPKYHDSAQPRFKNLVGELGNIWNRGMECHRNSLREQCSHASQLAFLMMSQLDSLSEPETLQVCNKDIHLFSDLANTMDEQIFHEFLNCLLNSFFKKAKEIGKCTSLKDYAPLTHPIYFYLCKSFQELIIEISGKTDISVKDLLTKNEKGKWVLIKPINWPSNSSLNQALEHQYRFIFSLMKHFQPGHYSCKSKFEHKFKLIPTFVNTSLWQSLKGLFRSETVSAIPEERLIWIYILDRALTNTISEEELKLFEPLLAIYLNFITETERDLYESFRIVTHNTARFIIMTKPYLSKEMSKIDQDILTKQIESIKNIFVNTSSIDFSEIVDVYNEYWNNRRSILKEIPDKFPYGKFKEEMEKICEKFLQIATIALGQKEKPQGLIKYFRSFNEFLEDLNSIEFSWFIKKDNVNDLRVVELVNEDKQSYIVSNPENFIKNCVGDPKHYLIEIVQDLLNNICNFLQQNRWPEVNLNASCSLLSAIRKSFLYLKEQPNYLSFDTFKDESTKPFISVAENSSTYEEFNRRIGIIGESFWYLRKQDEIDIDKALDLYMKENNCVTRVALKDCYNNYFKKFNFYIQETINKSFDEKVKFIIDKVKEQSHDIKTDKWNSEFKRKTLTKLLAGIAAVWSILESKDIGSKEKSLKPHCIQILCILRLLSVDNDSEGVEKHLAQVLTGQGKSLVLGLLSLLLSLTGHKVGIVCYNEFLTTRDQQEFNGLFKLFDVSNKITYGTFKDMTNEMLNPQVDGKKQRLRRLVEDRILNHTVAQNRQGKEDVSNTILLIDEVDVFFSDKFYGNTYCACNIVAIPGLASIHEKIWGMASKHYEKGTILKELDEFIAKMVGERNHEFQELNKFRYKPGKYYLLRKEGDVIASKEYTNKSLYHEHLEKMVSCAINVAKEGDDTQYKINDYGNITVRGSDGVYSVNSYIDYNNVFNYFKLKKNNFKMENYGYLNVYLGEVSYAKLPEKYRLILGVSGTLTTLHDHEKKAVKEYYNIKENSIMPSFFGHSHLKFNHIENFISQDSEEEWLTKIFSQANSKIGSGQSVLIFFETDVKINKFKEKFLGKFDRLHILTENTVKHSKEKYIDEAGVTKTVTLATRGMGRGTDFKSSVAVENNGGVHVIQTFFSQDIKEEIQIKGRTARKDNKGSYGLILCREHLIKNGFLNVQETSVDYQSLNETRKLKSMEIGSNNGERIKKSEYNHKATMDFLESFFVTV